MKAVTRCYSLILTLKRQITKYPVLAILLPLTVRVIPEVLMGAWPAGFDVITYYAPYIHDVKKYGLIVPYIDILRSHTAPLPYMVLGLIALIIPLDSLIIVKILSPLIYGFLGFAIYFFTKNVFGWKSEKAFLATAVATLYFVTLRFSWDMWKNTIGLAFFLLAISYADTRKYRNFLVYSLLCIFSNEVMAVFLGLVLTIILLRQAIGGNFMERTRLVAIVLTISFSFIIAGYYAGWIKIFPSPQPAIPNKLILREETPTFPYNYLSGEDWYNYDSEWDARIEASALMLKMYGPIIPFAILGWKRNKWMDSYIIVSILPFISIFISPNMAIPAWHRFAFLLTIPLAIHATFFLMEKRRLKLCFIALLVIFMFGYTLLTPEIAFPYYALFPSTYRYLPTSMLQNSVSKEDLLSVVNSLKWLNSYAKSKSCLLTHESYLGWAKFYIYKEGVDIMPYNMSLTVPEAAKKYYDHVYLIWWDRNTGFYGWNPPTQFKHVNQIGRIVVYEYETNSST